MTRDQPRTEILPGEHRQPLAGRMAARRIHRHRTRGHVALDPTSGPRRRPEGSCPAGDTPSAAPRACLQCLSLVGVEIMKQRTR
jgi:hypothetical protein